MPTFTPPGIPVIPPISVSDRATGPATKDANPGGWNLMKYFYATGSSFKRYRGVNVWRMNDGTYWMSDPVTGVTFTGTIGWPYPDTLAPNNNAISVQYFPGGPGGVGSSGGPGFNEFVPQVQTVTPGIAIEYLGGHSYNVSIAEAANLTAVGLGAYIV